MDSADKLRPRTIPHTRGVHVFFCSFIPCSPSPSQGLQLFHIFITQVQWGKVTRLTPLRSDKHATVLATLEVLLALHRAVVFSCRLVESDADPAADARNLGHWPDVRDCSSPVVSSREEANASRDRQAYTFVSSRTYGFIV